MEPKIKDGRCYYQGGSFKVEYKRFFVFEDVLRFWVYGEHMMDEVSKREYDSLDVPIMKEDRRNNIKPKKITHYDGGALEKARKEESKTRVKNNDIVFLIDKLQEYNKSFDKVAMSDKDNNLTNIHFYEIEDEGLLVLHNGELDNKKNDNFLTVEESKKSLEELKTNRSPGHTYLKKLEDFRESLNEDEIVEDLKFEHDMQDMKRNQLIDELLEEINDLCIQSSDIDVNKSDVIKILQDKKKKKN